ncbi:MAG: 16S rRNA (cytosine(1402)-N(4))-methyltransferase [Planctomycetia bacterium 21-64-5]|nr:MAG: 16S rRNA (cytosine(1402)-N(4))-methyltransferase [Planctomycetia bacterium 21-64-5]
MANDADCATMPAMAHVPVMLDEVLSWLAPRPGMRLVDGTMGAGGHTRALAQLVAPDGEVLAFDRDPAALAAAECALSGLPVKLVHANFAELPQVLGQLGLKSVDGVVLDLGLSSEQLADRERGFSFDSAGTLDLRFDVTAGEPAWKLLDRLGERELADLIYRYGEERFSRRIARRIVERRASGPVRTAEQLARLVRGCVPRARGHAIDPATRTFQALRIAVNDELVSLERALTCLPNCVAAGGRVAVIGFHSLEDRLVKTAFRDDARYEVLTRKPLRPSAEEVARNPRSRSAKLRVACLTGGPP